MKKVQAAKAPRPTVKRRQPEDRKLTVRAVARPEPNVKLLARAFIGLAMAQAKKEGIQFPSYRPPGADGDTRPLDDPSRND